MTSKESDQLHKSTRYFKGLLYTHDLRSFFSDLHHLYRLLNSDCKHLAPCKRGNATWQASRVVAMICRYVALKRVILNEASMLPATKVVFPEEEPDDCCNFDLAWGMWVHGYVPLSHSGTHPYEKLTTNKQQEARFVGYHGPSMRPGSKVKTFFMLNSTEHENFPAHKCENANNCWHFNIYEWEK